jgi:NADH dehydrogenase
MSKNVLVLGGTGFVGRHIVPKLVAAGHRVVVPTRSRDRARPLFPLPTCTIVEADIHDRAALGKLARGSDAVVNLVGILHEVGRETFARAHVDLTRNAIAACRDAGSRRRASIGPFSAPA